MGIATERGTDMAIAPSGSATSNGTGTPPAAEPKPTPKEVAKPPKPQVKPNGASGGADASEGSKELGSTPNAGHSTPSTAQPPPKDRSTKPKDKPATTSDATAPPPDGAADSKPPKDVRDADGPRDAKTPAADSAKSTSPAKGDPPAQVPESDQHLSAHSFGRSTPRPESVPTSGNEPDGGNARDKDAERTTASYIDDQVTDRERDELAKRQREADDRSPGGSPNVEYYRDQDYYVDPDSGKPFAVTAGANGSVRMERNDERATMVAPGGNDVAPEHLDEIDPAENTDELTRRYPTLSTSTGTSTGKARKGEAPAAPHADEPGGHEDGGSSEPAAKASPGQRRGSGEGDGPGVMDSEIVFGADGSSRRREVVSTASPSEGKPDITTQTTRSSSSDGSLTGTEVDQTSDVQQGDLHARGTYHAETDAHGRYEQRASTYAASDGAGDTWKEERRTGYEDGAISRDQSDVRADLDGIVSSERRDTRFGDAGPDGTALPEATEVERSVSGQSRISAAVEPYLPEPLRRVAASVLPDFGATDDFAARYGSNGLVNEFTETPKANLGAGAAPDGDPPADSPRFRFGRDWAPTEMDAPGGAVDTPGVLGVPGVEVREKGIGLFETGGRALRPQSEGEDLQGLREDVRNAPDALLDNTDQVNVVNNGNPQDVYWEAAYGQKDFTSAATAGNGEVNFYGGSYGNGSGTLHHELGHSSGDDSGAPSEDAWGDAIADDRGRSADLAGKKDVEPTSGVTTADQDGVTSYAELALSSSKGANENEDWADSVRLYMQSREQGGIMKVETADGGTRAVPFEELFPARAKILDGYYELGAGS